MLHCQSRYCVCKKKDHHSKDCKSKRTCFWFTDWHNTSTYQRDSYKTQSCNDKTDGAGKDDEKKVEKTDVIENRAQKGSQVLVANTVVSNRRVVLMQTATSEQNIDY